MIYISSADGTTVGTIKMDLSVDFKEFEKGLGKAGNKAEQSTKKIQDKFETMGNSITASTESAIKSAVSDIEGLKKAAANLSKTNISLGDINTKGLNSGADIAKDAFKSASTKKSAQDAAKAVNDAKKQIDKTLSDGERNAKSKASSMSSAYKKSGSDTAGSIKKSWDTVNSESGKTAQKVKKDAKTAANSVNRDINSIKTTSISTGNKISSISGGLASTLKGAFATLGVGYAIKECTEAASDLAEVQNVVDTAFKGSASAINDFASTANVNFGLSETMAKKYAGTFGVMGTSMGLTESAALDMSKALTGLTGDVASFYNISQDEAYTKMKSVFTGETEALKELGIVMTQTNLNQYALSNGFGKTLDNMTQQEAVMLRYQYVMSGLSNASGDFAKTQDSWANQTRILTLNFQSLKAALGRSMIAVLNPLLKAFNAIMVSITAAANAFSDFVAALTGTKVSTNTSTAIDDLGGCFDSAADSGSSAADSIGSVGDAASDTAKAVKEASKQLMGFDNIHKLNDDSSDTGSGSGGSGVGGVGGGVGGGISTAALDNVATSADNAAKKISALNAFYNELSDSFKSGLSIGIGEDFWEDIQSIKDSCAGIANSMKEIFTAPEVIKAGHDWAVSTAESMGVICGAAAQIGVTTAKNIVGGIDQSLRENKDFFKGRIVEMFDINSRAMKIQADFIKACADIFDVFGSDKAIDITSDIVSMFTKSFANITLLGAKLGTDIIDAITKPIRDNKEEIKTALEKTLEPLSTVIHTIYNAVDDTWEEIQKLYDGHISPAIRKISNGFSNIFDGFLEGYNKNIAPTLKNIADKFSDLYDRNLKPNIEKISNSLGKIIDTVSELWEDTLAPVIKEIVKALETTLAPTLELVGNIAVGVVSAIADGFGDMSQILTGAIDVIVGICKGDWSKAWQGIKDIAIGFVSGMYNGIKNIWNTICNVMNLPDLKAPNVGDIKGAIINKWNDAKKWWDSKGDLKDIVAYAAVKFSTTWNDIKSRYYSVVDNVRSKTAYMYAKVSTTWSSIKSKWYDITDRIKGKTAYFYAKVATASSTISKGWNKLSSAFKSKTVDFAVKLTTKVGSIKNFVNDIIKAVNTHLISKLDFTVKAPSWLGGGSWGWKAPRIPYLAKGGVVDQATLAMVGEAGKEAVMPLENNTGWISVLAGDISKQLDNQTPVLTNVSTSGTDDSNKDEEIAVLRELLLETRETCKRVTNELQKIAKKEVTLDGKKVTKAVIDRTNEITDTTGECPINLALI